MWSAKIAMTTRGQTTMTNNPYAFQDRVVADTLAATGNTLIVAPTGSGKSHIIEKLIAAIPKDARIVVVTHRAVLIQQNVAKLPEGTDYTVFCADLGTVCSHVTDLHTHRLIFASVQSLARYKREIGKVDYMIVDEAHLVTPWRVFASDTNQYDKLIDMCLPDRIIGLTATPWRLGGGFINTSYKGRTPIWNNTVRTPNYPMMVHLGILSEIRDAGSLSMIESKDLKVASTGDYTVKSLDVILDTIDYAVLVNLIKAKALLHKAKHKIIFMPSIESAMRMMTYFTSSAVVSSDEKHNSETIARFKAGEIEWLINVNILTTGFDFPDLDFMVIARPTTSTALYEQMIGRVCRLKSHGNNIGYVLDVTDNYERHGIYPKLEYKDDDGTTGEKPERICDETDYIAPRTGMTKQELTRWLHEQNPVAPLERKKGCGRLVRLSAHVCPFCRKVQYVPTPKSFATGHDYPTIAEMYVVRPEDVAGLSLRDYMRLLSSLNIVSEDDIFNHSTPEIHDAYVAFNHADTQKICKFLDSDKMVSFGMVNGKVDKNGDRYTSITMNGTKINFFKWQADKLRALIRELGDSPPDDNMLLFSNAYADDVRHTVKMTKPTIYFRTSDEKYPKLTYLLRL